VRKLWRPAVLLLAAFGASLPHANATSCPASDLSIGGPGTEQERSLLTAGESRSIVGRNWLMGVCESGGCWYDGNREPYAEVDVRITGPVTPELEALYEKERGVGIAPISTVVGRADPLEDGSFALLFVVPDVPTGTYWIVATDARPTPVRIEGT